MLRLLANAQSRKVASFNGDIAGYRCEGTQWLKGFIVSYSTSLPETDSAHQLPATLLSVRLAMPAEAIGEVKEREQRLFVPANSAQLRPLLGRLQQRAEAQSAYQELHQLLSPDTSGFAMLCCMLRVASAAEGRYRQLGIDAHIFEATMGCFTRFVCEHRVSYGGYGFDLGAWTIRELCLRLFRLGELEFELADQPVDVPQSAGSPRVINMHIPSDAHLEPLRCKESCEQADTFIKEFFSDWSGLPVMCSSWLLSPALQHLLPENSHIMEFQRLFDIVDVTPDAQDWREWVFQRNDAPIGDLPERTSLQRNMKAYLLKGGHIGIGVGRLVRLPAGGSH